MENNPSLGRPYRWEVDAALQEMKEAEQRREIIAKTEARRLGHLRGPYLVQPKKPVLVVKLPVFLVLIGTTMLLCIAGAYGLTKMLFPNM